MLKRIGFTNNQLKLIAVLSMLSDHIGKQLLPQFEILQIFGRLAMPIFAYMIAEGCFYTKNKRQYLMRLLILALGCQAVYFFAEGSLYQNILVTFSLSVITIFAFDNFIKNKRKDSFLIAFAVATLLIVVCIVCPLILKKQGFCIDYGFFGVLLPVAVYFSKNRYLKLISLSVFLVLISFDLGGIQWFSLFSVLVLLLYNGKRGRLQLKYLFYVFYPLHLAVIYLIKLIISA